MENIKAGSHAVSPASADVRSRIAVTSVTRLDGATSDHDRFLVAVVLNERGDPSRVQVAAEAGEAQRESEQASALDRLAAGGEIPGEMVVELARKFGVKAHARTLEMVSCRTPSLGVWSLRYEGREVSSSAFELAAAVVTAAGRALPASAL